MGNVARALIIQHEDSCPPGTVAEWLSARQIPFDVVHAQSLLTVTPKLSSYSLLIVLGGPMNVDQETEYPWLRLEKKLILSFLQAEKKVVGLCLGGQLLAEVLGANVSRAPHWESGFHQVHLENLPGYLGKNQNVFQWHGYQFEIPSGAQRIATGNACKNQAFLYKNLALGTQFHPETDQRFVELCIEGEDADLPEGPFCQSKAQILENMRLLPQMRDWFFHLLDFHING